MPDCGLCEEANGRPMAAAEADTLLEAMRQADRRRWAADWWLDVPFEDGTTPRQGKT